MIGLLWCWVGFFFPAPPPPRSHFQQSPASSVVPVGGALSFYGPSLFVQPAATSCDVHIDAGDTSLWLLVARGRKRWRVFRPEAWPRLVGGARWRHTSVGHISPGHTSAGGRGQVAACIRWSHIPWSHLRRWAGPGGGIHPLVTYPLVTPPPVGGARWRRLYFPDPRCAGAPAGLKPQVRSFGAKLWCEALARSFGA